MLVRTDGSIAGTIGGGPLEAVVIESAVEVLGSGSALLMHFDSDQLGTACGGGGRVLIEYVDSAEPATLEVFRALADLIAEGRKGWLVAAIRRSGDRRPSVEKCLVDAGGSVYGKPVASADDLQELVQKDGSHPVHVTEESTMIYVQPVGQQGTVYVFGAGHCGESLVPLLGTVGFRTVVVDDRADFASGERFPAADRIVNPESFDEALAGLAVDGNSYIVILTRGHVYDQSVLRQALRTKAAYIGMMGSQRKVAQIFKALGEEGFSPQTLARVHAPIGLPIGAETPEEIAVSIAAELIQVRAERGG
jgi:xanthine dehydrogenase accessory factor